jgi:ABC-type multidrug transport system ATPase subunit
MEMTALGPFTQRLAGRLSGGMKQKLGLACTLVRTPELLLLDEPTVGVDPLSRRELWEIIRQLVNDQGVTVLLSTSYLDEAERCGHVIVMHQGRVLAQGRPVMCAVGRRPGFSCRAAYRLEGKGISGTPVGPSGRNRCGAGGWSSSVRASRRH